MDHTRVFNLARMVHSCARPVIPTACDAAFIAACSPRVCQRLLNPSKLEDCRKNSIMRSDSSHKMDHTWDILSSSHLSSYTLIILTLLHDLWTHPVGIHGHGTIRPLRDARDIRWQRLVLLWQSKGQLRPKQFPKLCKFAFAKTKFSKLFYCSDV